MEKKGFRGQRNENGRPKGSLSKTTAGTKALQQKIVSEELDYLPLYLDALEPKERLELVFKLIGFVIPWQSQASIDLTAEIESRFTPVYLELNINPPKKSKIKKQIQINSIEKLENLIKSRNIFGKPFGCLHKRIEVIRL